MSWAKFHHEIRNWELIQLPSTVMWVEDSSITSQSPWGTDLIIREGKWNAWQKERVRKECISTNPWAFAYLPADPAGDFPDWNDYRIHQEGHQRKVCLPKGGSDQTRWAHKETKYRAMQRHGSTPVRLEGLFSLQWSKFGAWGQSMHFIERGIFANICNM